MHLRLIFLLDFHQFHEMFHEKFKALRLYKIACLYIPLFLAHEKIRTDKLDFSMRNLATR